MEGYKINTQKNQQSSYKAVTSIQEKKIIKKTVPFTLVKKEKKKRPGTIPKQRDKNFQTPSQGIEENTRRETSHAHELQ